MDSVALNYRDMLIVRLSKKYTTDATVNLNIVFPFTLAHTAKYG